jgi:hypothetical protein
LHGRPIRGDWRQASRIVIASAGESGEGPDFCNHPLVGATSVIISPSIQRRHRPSVGDMSNDVSGMMIQKAV